MYGIYLFLPRYRSVRLWWMIVNTSLVGRISYSSSVALNYTNMYTVEQHQSCISVKNSKPTKTNALVFLFGEIFSQKGF